MELNDTKTAIMKAFDTQSKAGNQISIEYNQGSEVYEPYYVLWLYGDKVAYNFQSTTDMKTIITLGDETIWLLK